MITKVAPNTSNNFLILPRQYGRNGGLYDKPSDSYVLGIGTGALAAVAISSCISLSELLPLAVKTVGIAFRLGLYTVQVGESITKHASSDPLAWSMTISDLAAADANQALCTFLEENVSEQATVSLKAELTGLQSFCHLPRGHASWKWLTGISHLEDLLLSSKH